MNAVLYDGCCTRTAATNVKTTGQTWSKSALESSVCRSFGARGGGRGGGRRGKEEVWVDSRKYKFVLRHRVASFLSLFLYVFSLLALSLLCLFPTPPAYRKGRQLNNAWRRFAGPQISSSARSPRDANPPFPYSFPYFSPRHPLILSSCTSVLPPPMAASEYIGWTIKNVGHQLVLFYLKLGTVYIVSEW